MASAGRPPGGPGSITGGSAGSAAKASVARSKIAQQQKVKKSRFMGALLKLDAD
jgi:hypothetical protein